MIALPPVVRMLILAAALLAAAIVLWVVVSIRTDRPVTYEAIEDHFKY